MSPLTMTGMDTARLTWATALQSARIGHAEGTSIEVIDLRSLSPIDFETIEKDGSFTLRERDSMQQRRIGEAELFALLDEKVY